MNIFVVIFTHLLCALFYKCMTENVMNVKMNYNTITYLDCFSSLESSVNGFISFSFILYLPSTISVFFPWELYSKDLWWCYFGYEIFLIKCWFTIVFFQFIFFFNFTPYFVIFFQYFFILNKNVLKHRQSIVKMF